MQWVVNHRSFSAPCSSVFLSAICNRRKQNMQCLTRVFMNWKSDSSSVWWLQLNMEDPCIICHEDMNPEHICVLDCRHSFHDWVSHTPFFPNSLFFSLLCFDNLLMWIITMPVFILSLRFVCFQCIRQWLKEKNTCPNCRVHTLLSDFPLLTSRRRQAPWSLCQTWDYPPFTVLSFFILLLALLNVIYFLIIGLFTRLYKRFGRHSAIRFSC